MAMEDKPEDIVPLDIKPPAAGRPNIPGMVGQPPLVPQTPEEIREELEARKAEEGLKERPVETTQERAVPPPPNAAGAIRQIAEKLESWAQHLAGELAAQMAENKELKAELHDLSRENRKMAEELSGLDSVRDNQ